MNFMALKMIVEFAEGSDPKTVMKAVLKNCKKGRGRLRDLSVRSETCRRSSGVLWKEVTNMTKKQKKVLWRIIATAVLVAVVKLFSIGGVAGTVLYLAAYLIIGYDILRKAFLGHHQGSGVRRELPDGVGHRGCHCTGRLREKRRLSGGRG